MPTAAQPEAESESGQNAVPDVEPAEDDATAMPALDAAPKGPVSDSPGPETVPSPDGSATTETPLRVDPGPDAELSPEERRDLSLLMGRLSRPEQLPEIDPDADLAADLNLPKPLPRRKLAVGGKAVLDESDFKQAEAVLRRYGVREADRPAAVNALFSRLFGDAFTTT